MKGACRLSDVVCSPPGMDVRPIVPQKKGPVVITEPQDSVNRVTFELRVARMPCHRVLIAVVVGLIGAIDRHVDVVSLLLGELSQLHADLVEV